MKADLTFEYQGPRNIMTEGCIIIVSSGNVVHSLFRFSSHDPFWVIFVGNTVNPQLEPQGFN